MYAVRQHKETMSRTLPSLGKQDAKQFIRLPMPHILQTHIKPVNSSVLQFGKKRKRQNEDNNNFTSLNGIYAEFVLKEDAEKISQYTIDRDCAISIRQTGAASLARLKQGAGAKPHTILDKSFKKKTAPTIADGLKITYKDASDALKQVLAHYGLPKEMEGHVPHWASNDSIDGFYLTSNGYRYCHGDKQLRPKIENSKYLIIKGCKKLIKKNRKSWHECFLTGDYDVHDIVKFSKFNRSNQNAEVGIYPRIPKASDIHSYEKIGDTGMLRDINEIMGYNEDQKRFQHGSQIKYLDYTLITNERIVSALLHPDFPIALCDRGIWSIIRTEQQLKEWYDINAVAYGWPSIRLGRTN